MILTQFVSQRNATPEITGWEAIASRCAIAGRQSDKLGNLKARQSEPPGEFGPFAGNYIQSAGSVSKQISRETVAPRAVGLPGRYLGGLGFFGDDVGGAVGAAKHDVGFVVADDLLRSGIEG